METTTYKVITRWGSVLLFRANLAQASATIETGHMDYETGAIAWSPTQFQTADARHDALEAAVLVVLRMGVHWYTASDDDRQIRQDMGPSAYVRKLVIDRVVDEDGNDV